MDWKKFSKIFVAELIMFLLILIFVFFMKGMVTDYFNDIQSYNSQLNIYQNEKSFLHARNQLLRAENNYFPINKRVFKIMAFFNKKNNVNYLWIRKQVIKYFMEKKWVQKNL